VIVFSGTPGEVRAMERAWRGRPGVVADVEARRTADSAGAAATLARARGIATVVVVTSWWHVPRAWLLFRAVAARGTRVRFAAAGGPCRVWDVARELLAVTIVPAQAAQARRRASATLERAPT
jgi:hypothetical protein